MKFIRILCCIAVLCGGMNSQALGFEGDKLEIQVSKQNTRELSKALCRSQAINEQLENGMQLHRAYYKLNTGEVLWDFE